jgi:hypothetical protein
MPETFMPGDKSEPFFGTPKAQAVLQNPAGAFGKVENTVNVFAPAVEQLYDFHRNEWLTGTSLALWNFSSKQVPLASFRAGWALETMPYGELKLDLPGITTRFITPLLSTDVKGTLTAGALDGAWMLIGKYAHVGGFGGWDYERRDTTGSRNGFRYGVSVGLQVTF